MINSTNRTKRSHVKDGFAIRRKAVDSDTTLVNDIKIARALVDALEWRNEHGKRDAPRSHNDFLGLLEE